MAFELAAARLAPSGLQGDLMANDPPRPVLISEPILHEIRSGDLDGASAERVLEWGFERFAAWRREELPGPPCSQITTGA